MNVLQILPELRLGGVERGTVEVTRYLLEQGHKAVVVSWGGELVAEVTRYGGKHYRLPVHRKSPFIIWPLIRRVAEIIEKEEIDLVHARSRVPALIGFFAARRKGRPFITTAHGYYRCHPLSRVMGWGTFVIAISNAIAKHMQKHFNVPGERIRLIPRGVSLDDYPFTLPSGRRRLAATVAMICRMTPLKGHQTFLEAMAIVRRTVPDVKIVIAGSAPGSKRRYEERIRALARRLGLEGCTRFVGRQDDVPAFLGTTDLLVSATRTPEAFGRVIIEAQATGIPVVATRVGGVVDIIEHGQNGLLCEPNDPAGMAKEIIALLQDLRLRDRIAQTARQKVAERFSLAQMLTKTLAVYEEAVANRRIAVIKLGAVGDVILAIPSLKALRAAFPRARLAVVVGARCKDVLARCPYVDELIVYDGRARDGSLPGFFRFVRRLQRLRFDIVIDLQNNRRSHLLSFLSFAPVRYGYAGKWGWFLTRQLPRKQVMTAPGPVAHQFGLLHLLGVRHTGTERLEFWIGEADREWARSFLEAEWVNFSRPLIGINVSASLRWESKRWPVRRIAQFCDLIAQRLNARVILTGAAEDRSLAQKVVASSTAMPVNAVGKTNLARWAALIESCAVFVTADTAAMHLAACMAVPFVALFGPTDPARHLPPNASHIVLRRKMACQPCYRPGCFRATSCVAQITPDEVLGAIGELLKKS